MRDEPKERLRRRLLRSRHKNKLTADNFRPGALKMLPKETSLNPNVAVSPEKQLSSLWRCKPDKYYTALPKLNMQTFAPVSFGAKILTIAKQKF